MTGLTLARYRAALVGIGTLLASAVGCTIAPGPSAEAGVRLVPPPGYGTLRQEDVSVAMATADLRVMVTPLHASVTHVTAPDTEARLSSLLQAHVPTQVPTRVPTSTDGVGLFLVSFYSDRPDVPFEPEDLQIVSRGIRLRPVEITPVTPGWGEQRVDQRETEMAIYDFGDRVDLESPIVVAYGTAQSSGWASILPVVQAERVRARSRAALEGTTR